jgi:hypothetical protein
MVSRQQILNASRRKRFRLDSADLQRGWRHSIGFAISNPGVLARTRFTPPEQETNWSTV